MNRRANATAVILGTCVCVGVGVGGCGGGGGGGGAKRPLLERVIPERGLPGDEVSLVGKHFGDDEPDPEDWEILFHASPVTEIVSWSPNEVRVIVPDAAPPGLLGVSIEVRERVSGPFPFTVEMPRAVYVHDGSTTDEARIYAFAAGTDGSLSPLSGSPHGLGSVSPGFDGESEAMFVHARTRRLYATTIGYVGAYDIHPRTGALSEVPGSPFLVSTGTTFHGITGRADGDRLYTAGYDEDVVYVLAVASRGSVAVQQSMPGHEQLDVPVLLHDDAFVFFNGENGMLTGFRVGADGTLSAPEMFTTSNGGYGLEANPAGTRAYAANCGSELWVWDVDPVSGVATHDPLLHEPDACVSAMSFTVDGARLFAADTFDTEVRVFDVAADGGLTPVPGSPFPLGVGAFDSLEVSDDGAWLYVADRQGGADHGLSVFSVSAAGEPAFVTRLPLSASLDSEVPSAIELTF